jgi:hypothetical protein
VTSWEEVGHWERAFEEHISISLCFLDTMKKAALLRHILPDVMSYLATGPQ